MPSASFIILEWVCPIIGVLLCNFQSVAPWADLNTAVRNAQGLNGLNPTPWAFMLGNHLGWVAYGLLANNYFIFFADGPGLIVAFWLNFGAVKLMYSSHHQKQTRQSLVAFLQEKDMKREIERESKYRKAPTPQVDYGSSSSDEEEDKPDNDKDDVIPGYDDGDEKKDDGEQKEKDEGKFLEANDSIEFTQDSTKDMSYLQQSSKLFDHGLNSQDKLTPLPPERMDLSDIQISSESFDKPNSVKFGKQKSALKLGNSSGNSSSGVKFEFGNSSGNSAGNSSSRVEFGKQKSAVTFGNASFFGKRSSDSSMTPGEVFRLTEESKELRSSDHKSKEKSMTHSMIFAKSKSRLNFFPNRSKRKLATMHESLARMATSFAKRAEKVNEWGEIVWTVTSQQEPAKAPHENLVMGIIILWFCVYVVLGFYSHHDTSEDKSKLPLKVIGWVVIINQIFFYGAPLSRINMVVRTKKCDCIHLQSLTANALNCGLWFAYGFAIGDPFLWAPSGLGLFFSAIQFVLCAIYKRTKKSEDEQNRFSVTSMLVSHSALKARMSVFAEGADEDTSETMQKPNYHGGDEELDELEEDLETNNSKMNNTNDSKTVEYMTSFGHFSYLY